MTPISISKAQRISASVATAIPGLNALTQFAAASQVVAGLAADVRKLESQKSELKAQGRITSEQYWDIVHLEKFINYHLDDGFCALRAALAPRAPLPARS